MTERKFEDWDIFPIPIIVIILTLAKPLQDDILEYRLFSRKWNESALAYIHYMYNRQSEKVAKLLGCTSLAEAKERCIDESISNMTMEKYDQLVIRFNGIDFAIIYREDNVQLNWYARLEDWLGYPSSLKILFETIFVESQDFEKKSNDWMTLTALLKKFLMGCKEMTNLVIRAYPYGSRSGGLEYSTFHIGSSLSRYIKPYYAKIYTLYELLNKGNT